MKTYKIFISPLGKAEAVKQGWSWPGCVCNALWALVKKLWGIAAVLFGSGVFLSILMGMALSNKAHGGFFLFLGISQIGIPILVGSLGNQWREKNLIARGYEYKALVQAQTSEMALSVWITEEDHHEAVHGLPARR